MKWQQFATRESACYCYNCYATGLYPEPAWDLYVCPSTPFPARQPSVTVGVREWCNEEHDSLQGSTYNRVRSEQGQQT